jgi:hypothetical protein
MIEKVTRSLADRFAQAGGRHEAQFLGHRAADSLNRPMSAV